MPNGIIYIARNDSHPPDHYKIGKSDRADQTKIGLGLIMSGEGPDF